MTDITPVNQVTVKETLGDLSLVKYQPNGILNHSLTRLQNILDGRVELVDASNPFIYLLESSCLNAAFSIQEYLLLTRPLYPRLANKDADLYMHMSDKDYLGRFGEYARGNVTFNINRNAFRKYAVRDANTGVRMIRIPKHYQVSVDGYVFSLLAPIVIKETSNNIISVEIELNNNDNVFKYNTNYVHFEIVNINVEEVYISFTIQMPELLLEATEVPIEQNSLFRSVLNYKNDRQYYFFKAYYINPAGDWEEMLVTHSDQVYDINTPTCLIKVLESSKQVEYYIPPVYINTGRVAGRVKFVMYTTKGEINVDFSDYDFEDFKGTYNKVFQSTDLDDYTKPLNLVSKVLYVRDNVSDGRNGLTFDQLKRAVIDNSIGDRELPITEKQLIFEAERSGFNMLPDIDTITDRTYLLELTTPPSSSNYHVSRFSMDMLEYVTTIDDLNSDKNGVYKSSTDPLIVIERDTVFEKVDNQLILIDKADRSNLDGLSGVAKLTEFNRRKLMSTYYHNVLDYSDNEVELRAYELSSPEVTRISFDNFNRTTGMSINTLVSTIDIVNDLGNGDKGYKLNLLANVRRPNTNLPLSMRIFLLIQQDGKDYFLEADPDSATETGDEDIAISANIKTQYAIDKDNLMILNNFTTRDGISEVRVPLECKISILYLTDELPPEFSSSDMDDIIDALGLADDYGVVTKETLTINLGDRLQHLFTRTHSSVGDAGYETYDEDQYLTYRYQVWDTTGAYPIHLVGDFVLDEHDNPIIKAKKGEVKLDDNGNPIPLPLGNSLIYPNFLCMDYKAVVSTHPYVKEYRDYVRRYMRSKIVDVAKGINDQLLDNTAAYVVTPKSIDEVKVTTHDTEYVISSSQSFVISVYVEDGLYKDTLAKQKVSNIITERLDEYLYNTTELKRTHILNQLFEELRDTVVSIEFDKFTELNKEYITLLDPSSRISIRKLLTLDPTGYTLEDDLDIRYLLVR